MTILVRADGTPIERPEPPGIGADIETKIAYIRAMCAYHDEVATRANQAFTKELVKNLRA